MTTGETILLVAGLAALYAFYRIMTSPRARMERQWRKAKRELNERIAARRVR